MTNSTVNSTHMYCSRTHIFHFSATFLLKTGPTILFTHLKIILLQCFQFQFSVSAKISSIQTDPISRISPNTQTKTETKKPTIFLSYTPNSQKQSLPPMVKKQSTPPPPPSPPINTTKKKNTTTHGQKLDPPPSKLKGSGFTAGKLEGS